LLVFEFAAGYVDEDVREAAVGRRGEFQQEARIEARERVACQPGIGTVAFIEH